jgi:hypothetical protein
VVSLNPCSDFLRELGCALPRRTLLIEKGPYPSSASFGQQAINRPVYAACCGVELVDAIERGEIGLHGFDLGPLASSG